MVKRIRWSSIALRDFRATLRFYTSRNKSTTYSRNLVTKIDEVIHLLKKNPGMGKPTDNSAIRVYIKGSYKIFYEVNTDELLILMFWDTRRNPDELERMY